MTVGFLLEKLATAGGIGSSIAMPPQVHSILKRRSAKDTSILTCPLLFGIGILVVC